MSLSEDLYKEIIIEHSQNPSHNNHVDGANVRESGVNRSCGDEVDLELFVENGVVRRVGVLGRGCSISTASGSMMADAIEGKTIEQVEELIDRFKGMLLEEGEPDFPDEMEDLEALKGVKRYPIRVKCATLSWNTLEQALKGAMQL